jgi:hypothetical protein
MLAFTILYTCYFFASLFLVETSEEIDNDIDFSLLKGRILQKCLSILYQREEAVSGG